MSMVCPFCKGRGSAEDIFENEFILQELEMMASDWATENPRAAIIDKHACILTAYMNGLLAGQKVSK